MYVKTSATGNTCIKTMQIAFQGDMRVSLAEIIECMLQCVHAQECIICGRNV